MSFAQRHNKGTKFAVDTTGYEYKKLSDVFEHGGPEKVYQIAGLYINTKGRFEDHPVAIIPELKVLVDLPGHMTEEVRTIMNTDSDVEDINNGLVGIQIEKYVSRTYNRECLGIKWVDM